MYPLALLNPGEQAEVIKVISGEGLRRRLLDMGREVVKKAGWTKVELTERIDHIVLNRVLGIPIFLAAMWLMFKLTSATADAILRRR
jgi:ferrous iron transport protein B